MFLGWSPTGIEVIPGKSTKVRLGQLGEKMLRMMGLSTMSFDFPHTF
jgi:hypothetical protein